MLSRRKCVFLRARKIPPWQPLHDRAEGDVKESDLKKEQEREREILGVSEGVPDEITEINGKADFHDREERPQRHVAAGTPSLRAALDPVLGRALELGLVIEDSF